MYLLDPHYDFKFSGQAALDERKAEELALTEQLNACASSMENINRVNILIDEQDGRKKAALESANRYATMVGEETARIKIYKDVQAQVEEARASILPLRERIAAWEILAEFFGPTGAPQLIIDLSIPRLNELLAEIERLKEQLAG